jgi:4-aminobutyrate aminotransferase/(S)-3-amino-2-methylpropionate transaminase
MADDFQPARYARLIPKAFGAPPADLAKHAKGATITTINGEEVIDFAAGIGTVNAGHCPPAVVEAIQKQAEKLIHTCFQVYPYGPYLDVVEQLVEMTPGDHPKKGILFNSGAEAVENAIKIARNATGRGTVLCFEGAFHGRTLMALSLTSKAASYKRGFGPFMSDVVRIPYPYCLRCPVGLKPTDCDTACTSILEDAVSSYLDVTDLAAVIIEPVLGEGGFIPAPIAYLQEVRKFCDRTGAVMIADEVQSGMGRTGKMFAIEYADVVPDIVTIAKSIASGMPLSAVVGKTELLDAVQPGGLGGTYGGNPVACAAALATMKIITQDGLVERANSIGAAIRERAEQWRARWPEIIADVRGLGAMIAIELADKDLKPLATLAKAWTKHARKESLLLLTAGVRGNNVRLLPPLVIDDETLQEGLNRMERALAAAINEESA